MIRVSVLALCYNHEAFLEEALTSLEALPAEVEILIADDASQDASPRLLRQWQQKKPDWQFVFNKKNKGNCATFNTLLARAKGDLILDFATDDVLIPEQLLRWADKAASHPECGFCYADAFIFKRRNAPMPLFSTGWKYPVFPEGRILHQLFTPGLICPPAVLFSRNAMLEIGGYNEALSYEDMDCWLRLARRYPVCRYPEPVIQYRQHPASMSALVYLGRNQRHLQSTLEILREILTWQELQPAPASLIAFIRYHLRLCFFLQLPVEASGFYGILKKQNGSKPLDYILNLFSGQLPWISALYFMFRKARSFIRRQTH
jgi:glycosyltransferase involved in cell wall biosynthesis